MGRAQRYGLSGVGLVGRHGRAGACGWRHCCPRWRLGRSSFVLWGLELVGWDWAVVVCAFGVGVGVFGCEVGRLHFGVWSWWVGIGQSWLGRGWVLIVCEVRLLWLWVVL